MPRKIYPPTLLCDFYKLSHRVEYPEGTQEVYSTWTPRESRIEGISKVVAFGFQAFLKKWLIDYFNQYFFERPEADVVAEYKRVVKHTLGVDNPDSDHIRDLHRLGHLPLLIKALPEGTLVPIRVPMLTVENTDPHFFWLTNYVETMMSAEMWKPATVATIGFEYLKILTHWAKQTDGDLSFVQWQGHDFSMRGMSGIEDAKTSGMGHLLSFTGTDNIPAILAMEEFYNADIETELVGASVNATEHSVMSAGGLEKQPATYERLITKVHPTGILSIVSDTWDFWEVVGIILPDLKPKIMARDGKLVIRPDSGDPVKILCGDLDAENPWAKKGLIESLWEIFGGTMTPMGFKKLDPHIGAIYGDSITLARAEEICALLAAKGFASTNVVFGIGSFTYQYNTRDTFGFAMKATYVVIQDEERLIYKDPATDLKKMKKSQRGRVVVINGETGIEYIDQLSWDDQARLQKDDLLETIFENGVLTRDEWLSTIRQRLQIAL